jgi:hypothetical protein
MARPGDGRVTAGGCLTAGIVLVVVGARVVVDSCVFGEGGFVRTPLAVVDSFFDTTAYAPAAEPSTTTASIVIQSVRRRVTPRSS